MHGTSFRKMAQRLSLLIMSLSLATICLLIELAKAQNLQPIGLLPEPANSFHQLARSPASALLASSFFDFERKRAMSADFPGNHPKAFAGSSLVTRQLPSMTRNIKLEALASSQPHYSAHLDNFRLDQYHPLEEIYNYLDEIQKRYTNIQVFTIGKTYEQRPIKALEIINNSSDSDYVWLDALTHAREWITGTTMLYIIDNLVSSQNLRETIYRKNYIIVPVVNPDGYAYTWSTNRMWRKNRSPSSASKRKQIGSSGSNNKQCLGTDLNRNFDHSFGGEGASNDPCSHIYAGAYPFSEPETKSMADLLWSLKDRVKFYLTIHSFNQLWACPYAHTMESSASVEKHMKVLRSIQSAVYQSEGEMYEIGPLSTKLYVGSGFGIDFAYDKCGIEHSYLVELRDKGANGFVLPPDQIMPTARETLAGLQAGIRMVFGNSRRKR